MSTELHRLGEQDLLPSEATVPLLSATVSGNGNVSLIVLPTTPANKAAILSAPLNLTDIEKVAIAAAHKNSIGILLV